MLKATLQHMVSNLRSMKEIEQIQALVIKTALHTHSSLTSKLIFFTALSPLGNLVHAQAMFQDTTTVADPFICNTMIRAYASSAFPIKAIFIYNQMHKADVHRDRFSYTFALKACARTVRCGEYNVVGLDHKGSEIHCTVLKAGFHQDQHIRNSLVRLYSHCGLLVCARKLFEEMSDRSIASWNVMISAYDSVGDFASADCLLEFMPRKNVVSWNSLIRRHIRKRDLSMAKRVFHDMPEKDAVSWNSMIAGYVNVRDYPTALNLFQEMSKAGVEATEITLTSVLGVCAETGALEIGRGIHESLNKKQYKTEGYIGVALVDMYAKCGDLARAREVFNGMRMKPVGCWNAMIVGLAVHGYSKDALELFSEMEVKFDEVRPNRVTFIGVLIACSHKRLVEEGRQLFAQMTAKYKIKPDMKHYGCMVDLLSRCGLLDEAYEMIKEMPFEANSVMWRTMLGACRTHGNVEVAELCFQQLGKSEPRTDGDFVLLSNVYAEAERWDDVERLRDEMIGLKVSKRPGFSNIEMHRQPNIGSVITW